jgi:hypothetical protein
MIELESAFPEFPVDSDDTADPPSLQPPAIAALAAIELLCCCSPWNMTISRQLPTSNLTRLLNCLIWLQSPLQVVSATTGILCAILESWRLASQSGVSLEVERAKEQFLDIAGPRRMQKLLTSPFFSCR